MRLFFAYPVLAYKEALVRNDIKNILMAYPYASDQFFIFMDQYLEEVQDVNFILDSGAFSVWTLGQVITLKEYMDFAKLFKDRYASRLNSLYVVNLDKIPGEFGRKPSYQEVEDSAQVGRDNFLHLKDAGLDTIPVFHQHEDFKWLELMKQEVDYIGISPANDIATKGRLAWLDNVYADLRDNYKTHSFGGISERILRRYPIYSGDSSSWKHWGRWGGGSKFKLEKRTYEKAAVRFLIGKDVESYKKMGDSITGLWEARGIKWEK
jgi:hypothetical protein